MEDPPPFFTLQCPDETCQLLFTRFGEQSTHLEQLKIENEVLKISLNDCTTNNEAAIRELKRLLEKETNVVNILNAEMTPDATGMYPTCSGCVHYRQQVKAVREANAQEYRWVVHFAKTSKNMRLELENALIKEKTKYSQLKIQYDELFIKKTDPLSKDSEVLRLRNDLQEAKRHQSNANQTALMANKVTETLHKELTIAQERVAVLETEDYDQKIKIKALEEIVDACRRSEELKDCVVGGCKDYLCKRRLMDLYSKEKELRLQIETLHRERAHHLSTMSQLKYDSEQWKTLLHGDVVKREDNKEVLKAVVVESPEPGKKKAKVTMMLRAKLDHLDDLVMNLRSFFTVSPGWPEEELDEALMYDNFIADIEPEERVCNMQWLFASCHPPGTPFPSGSADKVCRKCFTACMQAIGGWSKKRGSKTVFTNVRMNRAPIFKNK